MEERKMKRKYADIKKVKEISKSTYLNLPIDSKEFKGNISLVEILEANKEWIVDKGKEEERCILGKGLKWLEIYPDNGNYCITAIYNQKREIVEWYIDVANGIGVEEGVPYEDDLYLDVVILPNGETILLDEEELIDAYKNLLITKEQHDLAYKMANEIIKNAKKRLKDLRTFCDKYLDILENHKI